MYHLTFGKSKGLEIAKVSGGERDGQILKLTEENPVAKDRIKKEIVFSDYEHDLKQFKPKDRIGVLNQLRKAYEKGTNENVFVDERISLLYEKIKKNEIDNKEVELEDGIFEPIIIPNKHNVFYMCGASGSGKSYLAGQVAKNYKKMYPKREVFLISKLEKDETIDKMKFIKRIDVTTFFESAPVLDEFTDSLVIFDDYEGFDKKLFEIVIALINDIAITGRHTNTDLILCQHNFTNYKATRMILLEVTHIVIYPASASNQALRYLLGTYCGLDTKQIQEVKKMKSKFVCLYRHHPNFLLGQTFAKLLH